MKVIVFGATGGTGSIVTDLLLKKGHHVTAYVRNPSKMAVTHDHLKVVKGNIYDSKAIGKVMKGQDAVISCLGSNTTKKSDQLTRMAHSITTAMRASGVERVIYMSTAGIEDEFSGYFRWFIKIILGNVIDDHKGAAAQYKQADFDYTIIRPMQLKHGQASGDYETSNEGLPKSKKAVSRANVASFMVDILDDKSYYSKSVAIAE